MLVIWTWTFNFQRNFETPEQICIVSTISLSTSIFLSCPHFHPFFPSFPPFCLPSFLLPFLYSYPLLPKVCFMRSPAVLSVDTSAQATQPLGCQLTSDVKRWISQAWYVSQVFHFSDETPWLRATWEGKGLFCLYFHIPSYHQRNSQGHKAWNRNWNKDHRGMCLLPCFSWLTQPAFSLIAIVLNFFIYFCSYSFPPTLLRSSQSLYPLNFLFFSLTNKTNTPKTKTRTKKQTKNKTKCRIKAKNIQKNLEGPFCVDQLLLIMGPVLEHGWYT